MKKCIKKLLEKIHNFMLDGKDPKWIYTLSVMNIEGGVIDKVTEAKIITQHEAK